MLLTFVCICTNVGVKRTFNNVAMKLNSTHYSSAWNFKTQILW
jgi:hypothetical protein